jgi:Flp pilus assembly pilin Flp
MRIFLFWGLLRDRRGTVTVEYVVVLTLVSLGVVAALAGLGVPLVRTYLSQTAYLITPFP